MDKGVRPLATMANIFLSSRVKYCPFHSQYVICSFPYDRSMIRFKNVLRFTVARGGPRFLSFSRLFPARTNSSVARHKIKLYRTRSSWKIIRVLGWNKATRIPPRQEIANIYAIDVSTEWRSKIDRREDEFPDRRKPSNKTLFTIGQFSEMARYGVPLYVLEFISLVSTFPAIRMHRIVRAIHLSRSPSRTRIFRFWILDF